MDRNYNDNELFVAVKNNDLELVENLITYKWMDVNGKNGTGETPIFYAIFNGNLDMIKLLMKHGADVNVIPYYGRPLLMYAFLTNDIDIITYLINNGAQINVTENGESLVHYCIIGLGRSGTNITVSTYDYYHSILNILFEKSELNVNTQHGDWGTTPLILAINLNDVNLVKKLIEHGADVNLKKYNGASPLSNARNLTNGDNIVRLLLENGAVL
jgi:ankyrin repeat protein